MFFALESFSQASINLTKQVQTISQALQTEERILQERLLQSIQFELADAAEKHRGKTSELDSQKIALWYLQVFQAQANRHWLLTPYMLRVKGDM